MSRISGDVSPISAYQPYRGFFESLQQFKETFQNSNPSLEQVLKYLHSKFPENSNLVDVPLAIPLPDLNNEKNYKHVRVILCRHGETVPNSLGVIQGSGIDASLNEKGRQQASLLGHYLSSCKPDSLYSSDLKRAFETAEIIRNENHWSDLTIQKVPGLKEISWGIWEGKKQVDIPQLLAQWEAGNFDVRVKEGESPIDCIKRAIPFFYSHFQQESKTIFVVAHGRLIRILLSQLLLNSLWDMKRFSHENTSLYILDGIQFDHDLPLLNHERTQNTPSIPLDSKDLLINETVEELRFPKNVLWLPLVLNDYSHLTQSPS